MKKQRVCIITLGCPRNYVDSQTIAYSWIKKGFSIVCHPSEAGIVVLNTCGFIEPAVKESIDVILSLEEAYKSGELEEVWIVGCLVERYQDELKAEFPWAKFSGCIRPQDLSVRPPLICEGGFAYVKICEGCVSNCSFCVIPKIRGCLKSRKMEDIIAEVNYVVECGKKEVILVGQDTTAYGMDLYGRCALEELLKKILVDTDVEWIRLMYAYPGRLDESLLDLIASEDKIVPYLDVPIQHTETAILSLMNRGYTREDVENLFKMCSERGIAIRTTVMVGFPQEKRKDFSKMRKFLENQDTLVRLGVFRYYPEEGSLSYSFSGRVSDSVKNSRYYRIRRLAEQIASRVDRMLCGGSGRVIIDGKYFSEGEDEGILYEGRTFFDAPEVDSFVVVVSEDRELFSGDIVDVNFYLEEGQLYAKVCKE